MPLIKKINIQLVINRLFSVEALWLSAGITFIIFTTKVYRDISITYFVKLFLLVLVICVFILNTKISKYLFHKKIVFLITYCFILFYFFKKYGLFFNSYIFYDDYPNVYATTKKGIDMLFQGGIFGWDSSLLGGYYSVADGNWNLSFFVIPFALIFGCKIGYNVFYLFSFLAFPLLVYLCVKKLFEENVKIATISMYLSTIFLLSFFKTFLTYGTIDNLVGLEFYIINLALFENFLRKNKLSSFFLMLSVTLTLYAHISYFLCSLLTFVILLVIGREGKDDFKRAGLLFIFIFICTLPYTWYFLKYRAYFIEDVYHFVPHHFNFSFNFFIESLKKALIGFVSTHRYIFSYDFIKISPLPLFLWIFFLGKNRKAKIFVFAFLLIVFLLEVSSAFAGEIIARMKYVYSIFFIIILSWIIEKARKIGGFTRAITWYTLLFIFIGFCHLQKDLFIPKTKFATIKDLSEYNSTLVKKIKSLGGNLILFENCGNWYYATESKLKKRKETPKKYIHLASLFTLETKKNFFSSNIEGFHHSIYRANAFVCGTYKGKFISEYSIDEINEVMRKWGIKYLVLWSKEAKEYFKSKRNFYKTIWEDGEWSIFEYLKSDPRSIAISNGIGQVEHRDYFSKIIRLIEVKRGDRAVLRTNYFPAWKAYYQGRRLDLYDYKGQIAFDIPNDKDVIIYLKFPRFVLLNIFSVLTIGLCFYLSRRNFI